MRLQQCRAVEAVSFGEFAREFIFLVVHGDRRLYCQARNEVERDEWIEAIGAELGRARGRPPPAAFEVGVDAASSEESDGEAEGVAQRRRSSADAVELQRRSSADPTGRRLTAPPGPPPPPPVAQALTRPSGPPPPPPPS